MSVTTELYTISQGKHLRAPPILPSPSHINHHPLNNMSNIINMRNNMPSHLQQKSLHQQQQQHDDDHINMTNGYDWELPTQNIIDEGTSTVTKGMFLWLLIHV
jgi:hypothetical protein